MLGVLCYPHLFSASMGLRLQWGCPRWECPADYAISSGEFGMWPEWSMRGVG